MDRLPPIPTPARIILRELAFRYLPILVFVSAVFGTAFLWRTVGPGGIPGIAEAEQTLVSAPQGGLLVRVLVPPYEPVSAGQPIAVLEPADPRISFDLLQAELALARLQVQPTLAEENALSFERVRVELLRTKSELAVARVNLDRAERVVERYTPLHREQLVSQDLYELALNSRDAQQAEVDAKESAVLLIEQRLADLSALGVPNTASPHHSDTGMVARLLELKVDAEAQMAPLTLVAPVAGLVHAVFRQAGESVVAGEPLFRISPLQPQRIVGYLRQPYSFEVQVGMPVEIATRDRPRRIAQSQITRIGARIEPITNMLAVIPPNALMDAGLPFVVALPDGFALRPGEIVDLRLRRTGSLFPFSGDSSPPATPPAPTAPTAPAPVSPADEAALVAQSPVAPPP